MLVSALGDTQYLSVRRPGGGRDPDRLWIPAFAEDERLEAMTDADLLEVAELERAADWRIKKLGENPDDAESAAAAKLLQQLADDLRGLAASAAYKEYQAICGWLDEFDGMAELAEYAQDYRVRIGVDRFPPSGEAYLRVLIGFAKDTFGSP